MQYQNIFKITEYHINQIASLETQIEEYNFKSKIAALKESKKALEVKIAALKESKKALEAEITALEESKKALEAEIADLKKQKTSCEVDTERLESKKAYMENYIKDLNLEVKIAALKKNKKALEDKITGLSNDRDFKVEITDLQKQKTSCEVDIARLEKNETYWKQKIKDLDLEFKIECSEKQKKDCEVKITDLEKQHNDFQVQITGEEKKKKDLINILQIYNKCYTNSSSLYFVILKDIIKHDIHYIISGIRERMREKKIHPQEFELLGSHLEKIEKALEEMHRLYNQYYTYHHNDPIITANSTTPKKLGFIDKNIPPIIVYTTRVDEYDNVSAIKECISKYESIKEELQTKETIKEASNNLVPVAENI